MASVDSHNLPHAVVDGEHANSGHDADAISDDDEFHDAESTLSTSSVPHSSMSTDEAVQHMYRAVDLFMENKFVEAEELVKPFAHCSMYHGLALSVLNFLHAVLSAERESIDHAVECLRRARKLANAKRKQQSTLKSVSSWFMGKDFGSFSRDEMEAELIYTECLLMRGVITFLQDEGLVSFARGGLRVRACYKSYKECFDLLSKDVKTGHEFTMGVKYGFGTFNLLMSMLPSRLLHLLEFIGYSGDKFLGQKLLQECSFGERSLRSFVAQLILLTYHTVIPYILGVGDGDLEEASRVLDMALTKYPKSALFLFFKGRLSVLHGEFEQADVVLQQSIDSQKQWPQLHHVCYWEQVWTLCFRQRWTEASEFADILFKDNKWSKASYLYIKLAALLMDTPRPSDGYDDIKKRMAELPGYKIRIAGRSVPFEKFAIERYNRFTKRGYLFLPAVEMLYMWNGFSILSRNQQLLEEMYETVRKAVVNDVSDDPDDHCIGQLLVAVCLRSLGKFDDAVKILSDMLDYATNSGVEEAYLEPYGHVEIGMCFMEQGKYDEARSHFDTAKTNYKKYALQSRLHFRMHAAMQVMSGK